MWYRVVCARSQVTGPRSQVPIPIPISSRLQAVPTAVCLCLQRVSGYYVRKTTAASIHISSHNILHTRTYHSTLRLMSRGRTVPWLRRLVAGFPPLRPGDDPRLYHTDLVVDKWHWGRLLPCHHSTSIAYSFNRLSSTLYNLKHISHDCCV